MTVQKVGVKRSVSSKKRAKPSENALKKLKNERKSLKHREKCAEHAELVKNNQVSVRHAARECGTTEREMTALVGRKTKGST